MRYAKPEDINSVIMESWKKCTMTGINPESPEPEIYSKAKTAELLAINKALINIFKESVQKVRISMPGNYIFFLTNKEGILLDYLCNKEEENQLKAGKICRGMSFREQSIGTNAISLAIKLKKPVYLKPEYHYCQLLKRWYCYTLPLKSRKGIIGFLDVSTINLWLKDELLTITELLGELIISEFGLFNQNVKIKAIGITIKQKSILGMLARGLTEKAVAAELGISLSTIKYHKKEIFKKLSVDNVCEAIAEAIRCGLIDI